MGVNGNVAQQANQSINDAVKNDDTGVLAIIFANKKFRDMLDSFFKGEHRIPPLEFSEYRYGHFVDEGKKLKTKKIEAEEKLVELNELVKSTIEEHRLTDIKKKQEYLTQEIKDLEVYIEKYEISVFERKMALFPTYWFFENEQSVSPSDFLESIQKAFIIMTKKPEIVSQLLTETLTEAISKYKDAGLGESAGAALIGMICIELSKRLTNHSASSKDRDIQLIIVKVKNNTPGKGYLDSYEFDDVDKIFEPLIIACNAQQKFHDRTDYINFIKKAVQDCKNIIESPHPTSGLRSYTRQRIESHANGLMRCNTIITASENLLKNNSFCTEEIPSESSFLTDLKTIIATIRQSQKEGGYFFKSEASLNTHLIRLYDSNFVVFNHTQEYANKKSGIDKIGHIIIKLEEMKEELAPKKSAASSFRSNQSFEL